MDGFYITVKNGLLDPKHVKAMGGDRNVGTIWLFLWLLDKMTIVDGELGEGKVLGGRPIKFEIIKKDLQISERTYNRWVKMLRDEGYIKTIRTPYGLIFTVFKAFKVFNQRTDSKGGTKIHDKADLSTVGDGSLLYDNTVDNTDNTVIGKRNGFLQKLPAINKDPDFIKYLADFIEEKTGDKKSRKAFELIAAKIPEAFIRETLSEIKVDGARNKGAVFVDKVKKYAERNI